jgi:putative SOS response-associated peptidase YedK
MCGRFYIDEESAVEIKKILEQIDAKYQNKTRKTGEIFPTNEVPILAANHNKVEPELSVWGFPNYNNKGVLINARSETALEKKTFREGILSRRCVIPSSGFFEWNSAKQKYYFQRQEEGILYMAGIYNFYQDECKFVILTTSANLSMQDIHQRMPVVLEKGDVEKWILDQNETSRILYSVPPVLSREVILK